MPGQLSDSSESERLWNKILSLIFPLQSTTNWTKSQTVMSEVKRGQVLASSAELESFSPTSKQMVGAEDAIITCKSAFSLNWVLDIILSLKAETEGICLGWKFQQKNNRLSITVGQLPWFQVEFQLYNTYVLVCQTTTLAWPEDAFIFMYSSSCIHTNCVLLHKFSFSMCWMCGMFCSLRKVLRSVLQSDKVEDIHKRKRKNEGKSGNMCSFSIATYHATYSTFSLRCISIWALKQHQK